MMLIIITKLFQFFEGSDGRSSMTRLMMFLCFWPATYVVYCNRDNERTIDVLAIYLSAFVLGYFGGKVADALPNIPWRRPAINQTQTGDINNVASPNQ